VQLERRQIGEQFRILDAARPPVRPAGITRLRLNGAGAALGLFLGIALAALLELRDTTFRSEQEVLDVFKLPVVALVPYVMTDRDRSSGRRRQLVASAAVTVVGIAGIIGAWSLELWKYVV
jgi:hypothetical protein